MEGAAAFVAAVPGLIAVAIGAAQVARSRVVRRHAGGARIALVALTFLAIGACHSIDENAFAHSPVSLTTLPFREPLAYSLGARRDQVVPSQQGLLASYFAGAQYDRLDHQQIDANVDFVWDAMGNPVISAPDGIDHSDGDFRLPDLWGIWSVVWEGYLVAPVDGTYLLRIHVNNGGWLEMKDGAGALTTVIDCAGGSSFEGDCDAATTLSAGPHYIRFSYFNNAPPSAVARLLWQAPGATDVTTVPTDALLTQGGAMNAAPSVTLQCPTKIFIHDGATVMGSFFALDTGQTWTATYSGFNQTAPAPVTLAADHTFTFIVRAPQLVAGTVNVLVIVTDSTGASGQATCTLVAVPKRVMLYLHGTTGSFKQDATNNASDFPSLFKKLSAAYAFRFFRYYEDAGNKINSSPTLQCQDGTRRADPAIDPASGMPLDLPPSPDPYPGVCDSNDDVEINAALLDGDIATLGNEFDQVTLLSNSGGGRMVRAYLAYAKAIGSPSLGLVDVVGSLEGVQQGTYVAAVYSGLDRSVDADPQRAALRDRIFDFVKPTLKHDPRRPLFQDVTPQSPNIVYTNQTVPIPDGQRYLNINGDIHVNIIDSIFLIPIKTTSYEIGDTVMLPGDDDPRALPELGGGRFLPSVAGRGASSDEWELSHTYDVHFDPIDLVAPVLSGEIARIATAPESHLFFGSKFDQLCVQYRGSARHLDAVVFDQIAALDSGLAPAPGTLGLGHRYEVACP